MTCGFLLPVNHPAQVTLLMNVYPGEASDGTADGSAVTGHYRSVNKGLSKLRHTGHVLLLVGVLFALQACGQVWDSGQP